MLNIGDIAQVCVVGYNAAGEGVARADGVVTFVPRAAVGDMLAVRVTKVTPRLLRGEISEIITHAANRVNPDCPHYAACGGCDFRHITREAELEAKRELVVTAFARLAGVSITPDVISGVANEYRGKVSYKLARAGEKTIYGFHARGTHDVVPAPFCKLLPLDFAKIAQDAAERRPFAKGVTIRRSHATGEVSTSAGEYIHDSMCGKRFKVSHTAFWQVNHEIAQALYTRVGEWVDDCGILLDLYCGVGGIGICAAGTDVRVVGVDVCDAAVHDARENAAANGVAAEYHCADMAKVNLPVLIGNTLENTAVILDPAKGGADKGTLAGILKMSPQKIVMLSCDPPTCARDVRVLMNTDLYKVRDAVFADMFPRTARIECGVLLEKV